MRRKRGIINFTMSEPEFLISVMDRHTDWAVIICLIGGGQEIHTGEAGLAEWFVTLQKHFLNWKVFVSKKITDAEYLSERKPVDLLSADRLTVEDRLHLAVSVRSFRSEKVSALVKAILDSDIDQARFLYTQVAHSYPILSDTRFKPSTKLDMPAGARWRAFWFTCQFWCGTIKTRRHLC